MQVKWLNPDVQFQSLILAADVGGTNTNVALVGRQGTKYTIILEVVFRSSEITGIVEPLKTTITVAQERRKDLIPSLCCISAAGAVINNSCNLTNCTWNINGSEVQKKIGIETLVINDFLAISYGLLTLDVNDKDQIIQMMHCDGSFPVKQKSTIAVIGPGTGLGVSFLVPYKDNHIPACSEGGHIAFAPFDDESNQFCKYLTKKIGCVPGVEQFVSGQGLKNIYHFYKDCKNVTIDSNIAEIDSVEDSEKPALISKYADNNESCLSIMKLFVRMFASAASNLACMTLPFGGLYLAGGIVTKDLKWIQEDNLFMSIFEKNYNPNILPLLNKVPVYVIRDYSISLYGAANAIMKIKELG